MAASEDPTIELQSRYQQQEAVAELGQRALATDDLDELFREATEAVGELLETEYCEVLEVSSGDESVRLRQGVGWETDLVGSATMPADPSSQVGYTLRSVEPIVTEDLDVEKRFTGSDLFVDHDVVSGISVILGSGEEPWGILGVHATERRDFSEHDVAFVQSVANLLASAIENVETRERRREEQELKDRIVEASPVGIMQLDVDGEIQFVNERTEEIHGRSREEIASIPNDDPVWGYVDADGNPLSVDQLPSRRVIETGEPVTDVEVGIVRADGERAWLSVSGEPLRDGDGTVTGVVLALTDVTEQRRLESELEATFDRITDAFMGIDANWTFTYVNDRAAELIDPERTGLVGRNVWETFPEIVGTQFETEYRRAMETQVSTSFEEYYPPLDTWFGIHAYPSETGLSVYFQDVSRRVELEERLDRKNRTLHGLHEITADRERSFEEKVEDLLELGSEFLELDVGFLASVDPEDDLFEIVHAIGNDDQISAGTIAPLGETYCQRTIRTDGPVAYRDAASEGVDEAAYETYDFDSYLGATVTVGDELYGTFCFCDDDPLDREFSAGERAFVELASQWLGGELERIEYERSLERYREYTDDVLDAIDDVFYVVDENGDLTRWNESVCDVSGYSDAEIESMHVLEFFEAGADSETIANTIAEAFETGNARVEVPIRTKDGARIPYEFVASTLEDPDGGRVLAGIGRNVTERNARERELQTYETIVETVNDGIYTVDADGYFTMVNERYAEMTGYDRDELIGAHASLVVDEDVVERAKETIESMITGDTVEPTLEAELETADGRRRIAEATFATFPIDDGSVERVGVVRDVTERNARERALEESERRYRTLLNHFPDGAVALFDDELQYTLVGGRLLDDIDLDDVIGESVPERYPTGIAERIEPHYRAAFDGEERTFEMKYHGRHLLAQTLPVRNGDGEIFAGMLVVQDVTEREENRKRLEELVTKLEASNERLEQFAYAASHDLQEPLRMVASYLQLLERRYGDRLDDDGEEFLEFAVDGAERMREMIEGLLTYSRIDTRGEPFCPVDCDDVIDDVRQDLQLRIEETGTELTVEDLPTVQGDEGQLRQLFANLLSNAVKYAGDERPRVHVSAERTAEPGTWEFAVYDDGIGIDDADHERIFEVFNRLHSHEEYEGTGIGLALCQRIVERHGGTIWVESTPGDGSTFRFTLGSVIDDPAGKIPDEPRSDVIDESGRSTHE